MSEADHHSAGAEPYGKTPLLPRLSKKFELHGKLPMAKFLKLLLA